MGQGQPRGASVGPEGRLCLGLQQGSQGGRVPEPQPAPATAFRPLDAIFWSGALSPSGSQWLSRPVSGFGAGALRGRAYLGLLNSLNRGAKDGAWAPRSGLLGVGPEGFEAHSPVLGIGSFRCVRPAAGPPKGAQASASERWVLAGSRVVGFV